LNIARSLRIGESGSPNARECENPQDFPDQDNEADFGFTAKFGFRKEERGLRAQGQRKF
jgi:hypothetical protein